MPTDGKNKLMFTVLMSVCVGYVIFSIVWAHSRFPRMPPPKCFESLSFLPELSSLPSKIPWPTRTVITPDNISQKKLVAELALPNPEARIHALTLSPSGRSLAVSVRWNGELIVWNLETMEETFRQRIGSADLSFRSDEKVLAFYTTEGVIGLIDIEKRTILSAWEPSLSSNTNLVAFGRDNQLLFNNGGYISSCDLSTHKNEELPDFVYPRTLIVNPSRTQFAYATAIDRDSTFSGVPILDIWPIDSLKSMTELTREYHREFKENEITATASTFDSLIATGHGNGNVHIIDVAEKSLIKTFSVPGQVESLDLNPSENLLAIVTRVGNYRTQEEYFLMGVYDIRTGRLKDTLQQDTPFEVRFSPDGHLLIVASRGTVTLWGVSS